MIYRVILNGRASTSATGDTARDERLIEAFDAGEARATAERRFTNGRVLVLDDVRCDEVAIVGIEKATKAASKARRTR